MSIMIDHPKSTNIAATGYDLASRTLKVRFKSSGDKVHQYHDVPPEVAEDRLKAKSIGRWFIAEIRDQYQCTVILDDEAEAAKSAAQPATAE